MEFVVGLTETHKQYDYRWVVVDRLTKFANFIHVCCIYLVEYCERILMDESACLYGILLPVISDRST